MHVIIAHIRAGTVRNWHVVESVADCLHYIKHNVISYTLIILSTLLLSGFSLVSLGF